MVVNLHGDDLVDGNILFDGGDDFYGDEIFDGNDLFDGSDHFDGDGLYDRDDHLRLFFSGSSDYRGQVEKNRRFSNESIAILFGGCG